MIGLAALTLSHRESQRRQAEQTKGMVRRGIAKITRVLLSQSLRLPKGTKILGARMPFDRDTIELLVEHDDLDLVYPGDPFPWVTFYHDGSEASWYR